MSETVGTYDLKAAGNRLKIDPRSLESCCRILVSFPAFKEPLKIGIVVSLQVAISQVNPLNGGISCTGGLSFEFPTYNVRRQP